GRFTSVPLVAVPPQPTTEAQKADAKRREARRKLIQDLTSETPKSNDLLPFVQRSALQTYTTIDRLKEIMNESRASYRFNDSVGDTEGQLREQLDLVARMIRANFGTRIFYVSIGGFDTHSDQRDKHEKLLGELGTAIATFFSQLDQPLPAPAPIDSSKP